MAKNKINAVLGPTNTGKTLLAIETMLSFDSGMIGFPLRLLAREVYDNVIQKINPDKVALITGEEKIIPINAKYYLCTVESMPIDKNLEFVAVDEIQMCADHERGHIFTDRLLNIRGEKLTMLMGSSTIKNIISKLDEDTEFINKERLSKLSYVGHKKISRIDRKTAIIAFSAEEVYAIAELVRRQKGGAAIVMGSLSPKTRNAQVELYQSGDVDFLVATDAIGMGINMDLENVYFSNLKKFDGKKLRRLNLSEIGQIAGRAGRYLNDGSFGITGDATEINSEEIDLIENHKFEEIRTLYWRNSKLNFTSHLSLLKSLEEKPNHEWLRRIHECEDEKIFKYFIKENNLPVLLENLHRTPSRSHEDIDLPYKLPFLLKEQGILVGLTLSESLHGSRNLPFIAGTAAGYGLGKEEALKMITSNTAKILGIDKITGTLEVGKDANIVISSGDLLDMMTSNVERAFITGREINLKSKQQILYDRFKRKYSN